MINFKDGDFEKFKLIDKFLRAISVEELKTIVESDLIVEKLRIRSTNSISGIGPFEELMVCHNSLEEDCATTRLNEQLLRNDFQNLLRILDKSYNSAVSQEFNFLKNKYGIYN